MLVEPAYNQAMEEQALSRAYRHGQTHATDIIRMHTVGTYDDIRDARSVAKMEQVAANVGGPEALMNRHDIPDVTS